MAAVFPFTLDHALALIRLVVGLLLAGHGAQKLFGWWGGPGLRGMAGWLGSMGLPAPWALALFVALCEFLGGLAFALGLLTPLAALAITAVMLGAIGIVHWAHGLWVTNHGFEYPLVILATAVAIGLAGPGVYALDAALKLPLPQQPVYLLGVALEVLGLLGLLALRRPQAASRPAGAAAT
ncbi:MAG TPA: DoxX family protein [Chloroflexota bacterium]|jgi:putative oxidoreductase|nr:DoxX family protein [Chloroflexota bacterium]